MEAARLARHAERLASHMGTEADLPVDDLPRPAGSSLSPDVVRSYRWQLTPGEDVVDTATWAGSIPHHLTLGMPGGGQTASV